MTQLSRTEILTGVSDQVRTDVEIDLLAATRGPEAVTRRLASVDETTLRSRYRALLAITTTPDLAPSAEESFVRAEADDEGRYFRRGGNR